MNSLISLSLSGEKITEQQTQIMFVKGNLSP